MTYGQGIIVISLMHHGRCDEKLAWQCMDCRQHLW
ncbi:Uncharacterised protein [Vibrio cholerae]|nr:Uncharacterised protein [Vibrio cholerae]